MLAIAASTSYVPPRAAVRMMQTTEKLQSPIPWMERPAYLDGSLAGDAGFDPLNFVTKYSEGVKFKLLIGEFDKEDTEFMSLMSGVDDLGLGAGAGGGSGSDGGSGGGSGSGSDAGSDISDLM